MTAQVEVGIEDTFQAVSRLLKTIPIGSLEQQLEHIVEGAVKEGIKLGVQKSYHIQILNSPTDTIAHEFNTYYLSKAVEVILNRNP